MSCEVWCTEHPDEEPIEIGSRGKEGFIVGRRKAGKKYGFVGMASQVSKFHCKLTVTGKGTELEVQDDCSTNGTFLVWLVAQEEQSPAETPLEGPPSAEAPAEDQPLDVSSLPPLLDLIAAEEPPRVEEGNHYVMDLALDEGEPMHCRADRVGAEPVTIELGENAPWIMLVGPRLRGGHTILFFERQEGEGDVFQMHHCPCTLTNIALIEESQESPDAEGDSSEAQAKAPERTAAESQPEGPERAETQPEGTPADAAPQAPDETSQEQ
jgi:hypothetical protein